MSRQRKCRVCGGWHDLSEPWPFACLGHYGHMDARAHVVLRDDMPPLRSMLDGKLYDSKSALRRTYRAAGVEEIGNETQKSSRPVTPDRDGIRRALWQAMNER